MKRYSTITRYASNEEQLDLFLRFGRKIALLLLFFLGGAYSLSAKNVLERYAHLLTPPPIYQCLHTNEEIQIDGRLNEADWLRASHTREFIDIQGIHRVPPLYSTSAQLLWDEDYLYIGARLTEPNIVARLQQRDTIIWKENDFEVFLDPSGGGTHYYEFEVNARGTMMDLIMTRPYRSEGDFLMPWDCKGLRHAIHLEGSLNHSTDTDTAWTVEMAIPIRSLRRNFDYLRGGTQGEVWRLNFSRVQWLKPLGPEENWVWAPTGKIDIHMPERWGYLHFSKDAQETLSISSIFTPPYRLLWSIFYAQQDFYQQYGHYTRSLRKLGVTHQDLALLPPQSSIKLEASSSQFVVHLHLANGDRLQLNQQGEYRHTSPSSLLPAPIQDSPNVPKSAIGD